MGEKPVEDAVRLYGSNRVEGVLMTGPRRLELAGVLKRRVEDLLIRVPAPAAVREDFHAVRRAAALACGAAETAPMEYGCHRIDNHSVPAGPSHQFGGRRRVGAVSMRSQPGAL